MEGIIRFVGFLSNIYLGGIVGVFVIPKLSPSTAYDTRGNAVTGVFIGMLVPTLLKIIIPNLLLSLQFWLIPSWVWVFLVPVLTFAENEKNKKTRKEWLLVGLLYTAFVTFVIFAQIWLLNSNDPRTIK